MVTTTFYFSTALLPRSPTAALLWASVVLASSVLPYYSTVIRAAYDRAALSCITWLLPAACCCVLYATLLLLNYPRLLYALHFCATVRCCSHTAVRFPPAPLVCLSRSVFCSCTSLHSHTLVPCAPVALCCCLLTRRPMSPRLIFNQ